MILHILLETESGKGTNNNISDGDGILELLEDEPALYWDGKKTIFTKFNRHLMTNVDREGYSRFLNPISPMPSE